MEQALRAYAQHPVYIATVEGKRTIADVIAQMKSEGIVNTRVVVAPFMLVAGEHANNDMAGEENSFASILKKEAIHRNAFYVELQNIRQSVKFIYRICRRWRGALFADITTQNRQGILYGIGIGSGNPKQMTLQALEIIHSCDLIVLPAVTKEECYAYRIVEQVCPEISDMPLLCMPFPMIKDEKKAGTCPYTYL